MQIVCSCYMMLYDNFLCAIMFQKIKGFQATNQVCGLIYESTQSEGLWHFCRKGQALMKAHLCQCC